MALVRGGDSSNVCDFMKLYMLEVLVRISYVVAMLGEIFMIFVSCVFCTRLSSFYMYINKYIYIYLYIYIYVCESDLSERPNAFQIYSFARWP